MNVFHDYNFIKKEQQQQKEQPCNHQQYFSSRNINYDLIHGKNNKNIVFNNYTQNVVNINRYVVFTYLFFSFVVFFSTC